MNPKERGKSAVYSSLRAASLALKCRRLPSRVVAGGSKCPKDARIPLLRTIPPPHPPLTVLGIALLVHCRFFKKILHLGSD